jgi:hypothetical protein
MGRLSSTKGDDSSANKDAVAVKGSTEERKDSRYPVRPERTIRKEPDERTVWDEV